MHPIQAPSPAATIEGLLAFLCSMGGGGERTHAGFRAIAGNDAAIALAPEGARWLLGCVAGMETMVGVSVATGADRVYMSQIARTTSEMTCLDMPLAGDCGKAILDTPEARSLGLHANLDHGPLLMLVGGAVRRHPAFGEARVAGAFDWLCTRLAQGWQCRWPGATVVRGMPGAAGEGTWVTGQREPRAALLWLVADMVAVAALAPQAHADRAESLLGMLDGAEAGRVLLTAHDIEWRTIHARGSGTFVGQAPRMDALIARLAPETLAASLEGLGGMAFEATTWPGMVVRTNPGQRGLECFTRYMGACRNAMDGWDAAAMEGRPFARVEAATRVLHAKVLPLAGDPHNGSTRSGQYREALEALGGLAAMARAQRARTRLDIPGPGRGRRLA